MTFRTFFQKLTSRYLWGNLLAMGIVLASIGTGFYFFLDFYTYHGQTIEVPDVRGQSSEVAQRKLRAAGFQVEVSDTGYMPRLAGDLILDQQPLPGTPVKLNRVIYLTVNASSARTIALPDIADNCSLREAKMRLSAMGFKLGAVRRVTGDRDWVYSIEVAGKTVHTGDRIPINQPLILLVGDGADEEIFNGNDSLDQLIHGHDSVVYEEEIIE